MHMKKIIFIAMATFCLAACDNIAQEDRLIYEAPPVVNRSVLIEDFTGQRCINCPNASDEIHSLQQEYGEDAVIAVGIHGGPMALFPNPERGIVGLATDVGNSYNEYWKVEQWPMGMVNRTGVCPYTDWKAKVRQELQKPAPVTIEVSVSTALSEIEADVRVISTNGTTNGNLQVWIVEDNITAIQLMPDGTANREYVHQHVFRTAANGAWGESISIKEGAAYDTHISVPIASTWQHENLFVVAFVYDDSGVLQVKRTAIGPSLQ